MSMLMRMMEHPFFHTKQILVVDIAPKKANDRTWCFWEKEPDIFEPVVCKSWRKMSFHTSGYSAVLDLTPYQYKMIRGVDFYQHVYERATDFPNIHFHYEAVKAVHSSGSQAVLETATAIFTAAYIFNSILFTPIAPVAGTYFLWQHFKGWEIATEEPVFDADRATLMDFRVSQEHGMAFMYVMPLTATRALVEYTLFTPALLEAKAYEAALQEYIGHALGITAYRIIHVEDGVIPMTSHRFPEQEGRVWHIGVAGGQVKASSGYAFRFIQKRTKAIADALANAQEPPRAAGFNTRKFRFYDRVLLQVLTRERMTGADVFEAIFRGNPVGRVLGFLDNETGLADDIRIMNSVPTGIFGLAALRDLFR